jgi:hypothetical protein
MKKPLETAGGLLILGGIAGIVHWWLGWAPFGIVARVARATPYIRDHEIAAYVALIVVGLAVLVAADKVTDTVTDAADKVAGSRDGEAASEHDGG